MYFCIMKTLLVLSSWIIFMNLYAFAQNNYTSIPLKKISGTYQGYTSQDIAGGQEVFYKTVFKIKANKNQTVKGQSTFYSIEDSTQILVVYNFEGKYEINTQTLQLKEYEVVKKTKDWVFCFKEMPLICTINDKTSKLELIGTWTAKNCPNTGGKIRVIKRK